MAEITYKIVSDDLRTAPRDHLRAEWIQKVIDGKTLELPIPQTKLGGYYRLFTKQGLKLRTRALEPEKTLVWAEPAPTTEA